MDRKILDEHCEICLEYREGIGNPANKILSQEILVKINQFFQINLTFEEDVPSLICLNCVKDLNTVESFRFKCIAAKERHEEYYKFVTKEDLSDSNEINVQLPSDNYAEYFNTITNDGLEIDMTLIDKEKSEIGYKCEICSKILKSEKSLEKHNITMHLNRKHVGQITGFGDSRRYHCTKCEYSTPHSQSLVNHMRTHNGERPYKCQCGKSFTQKSSLTAHQKTHSDTTYYTCAVCGKQFKHAFTLKNHMNVHSEGQYTCNICQRTMKSKQSLRYHMNRHNSTYNFSCEECGATFVTSSELLNHQTKHSTEKNVECHLCGYKTHTKKNLIIHLMRHTGNKSYKCECCDFACYTRGELRRHGRVHTRARTFACPACARLFAHSSSLNKHARAAHRLRYTWADHRDKLQVLLKQDQI